MLTNLLKEKFKIKLFKNEKLLPPEIINFFYKHYIEYKFKTNNISYFLEANKTLSEIVRSVEIRKRYLNIIMNMEQIVNDFFDFAKPCPPQIPMCEQVREAYKKEVETATSTGCSACQKNQIKSRFMNAIWTEAVQSLISKVSS